LDDTLNKCEIYCAAALVRPCAEVCRSFARLGFKQCKFGSEYWYLVPSHRPTGGAHNLLRTEESAGRDLQSLTLSLDLRLN
jgi:hypothetical protein